MLPGLTLSASILKKIARMDVVTFSSIISPLYTQITGVIRWHNQVDPIGVLEFIHRKYQCLKTREQNKNLSPFEIVIVLCLAFEQQLWAVLLQNRKSGKIK